MARILLVGGTGTIGSAVALALLQEGHQVYFLARRRNGETPEQRVRDALSFYAQDTCPEALNVFEEDIEASPCCGLSENSLNRLTGEIEEVVNCAADLGFGQTRQQSWLTNVGGTQNLLELARLLGAGRFHHFSSAYVCGKKEGIIYENDISKEYGFHNVYEETKCEAEILLRDKIKNPLWCNTTIYRLGVVLGDLQRGGIIGRFNGYYGFANILFRLKHSLFAKSKKTPELSPGAASGIVGSNLISLQERLVGEKANLSMVSLDRLVETFLRIRENDDSMGLALHLTSEPVSCRKLLEILLNELKIKEVRMVEGKDYKTFKEAYERFLLRLEKAFCNQTQDFLPYLSEERWFDTTNMRVVLGKEYEPQVINEDQLRQTLSYAIGMFSQQKGKGFTFSA